MQIFKARLHVLVQVYHFQGERNTTFKKQLLLEHVRDAPLMFVLIKVLHLVGVINVVL
jgi:hypothetical protein